MSKTRGLLGAALFLCAAHAERLEAAGGKQGGRQKAAPAAGRKEVELSVRSSSATDAKCAFVRSFEDVEWTSPAGVSQIESFAERKGMFFPTAHLVSYYADVPVMSEALRKRASPISKPLAAAVEAFAALGDYLENEKREALVLPASDDTTGEEPSKGKRKKHRAKTEGRTISAALFDDKSATTLELAILAAAYAADAGAKAKVSAVPVPKDGGGLAGAKLLYAARVGDPITDAQVAAALAPAKYAAGYITSASPALADFNLLLPKEAYVCEALGILKDRRYADCLHKLLGHPDLRVQIEAVRALRKIGARESLPALLKKLDACDWPVLVEVCSALAALPAKESVLPLIARLKKETGRFRLDVTYALSSIAGDQIGQFPEEWEAWWGKEEAGFQVNEAASNAFRGTKRVQDMKVPALGFFYGLDIYSDHFSYVVDSSNSMKGDKMESLCSNLRDSVDSLAAHVQFNIPDFGGAVVTLCRKGLTKDKRSAMARVKEMTHSLGTRVYDAVEDGAGVSGVDTVFLLTDGMPTRGQLNRWSDLFRAMTIMNRYRSLTLSTVAFQPTPRSAEDLKQMACENVGLNCEAH